MKFLKPSIATLFNLLFLLGATQSQSLSFKVHEWGTFTSLCGSDGSRLNGLYKEEEKLPDFTYSIGSDNSFGNYYYNIVGRFPNLSLEDDGKGVGNVELSNVNVKMETPVLYFYSNDSFLVDAKVMFTHGLITQYFPNASLTFPSSIQNWGNIDFSDPATTNSIRWNAKVHSSVSAQLAKKQGETNTWTAPRATDANLVQVGGKYEKFLFYRGVGNFDLPVKTYFDEKANLVVQNNYPDKIPYFFVYDKEENGDTKVWFTGAIEAKESKTIQVSSVVLSPDAFNAKLAEFQVALTSAGLFDKESAAMLNTWKTSYFGKPGLRVFWIVPRKFTDDLLPLTLTPTAEDIQRVLIGRSEIMTPVQEKQMYDAYKRDKKLSLFFTDRFIEAYKERMAYLDNNPSSLQAVFNKAIASVSTSRAINVSGMETVIIYPNPTQSNLSIAIQHVSNGNVSVSISDITGRNIIQFSEMPGNSFYQKDLNLAQLAAGMYLVNVQTATKKYVFRVVKE